MLAKASSALRHILERTWDVVVIGTGAGGATAGYTIASKGRSVLFVERGKIAWSDPTVRCGVELTRLGTPDERLNHGWWPKPIFQNTEAGEALVNALGCGVGGSTAVFHMAMERLWPSDFVPRDSHRSAIDATLPDSWPISYEELLPYYDRAERLYRVRGTSDPLRCEQPGLLDPPAPTSPESLLFAIFRECGLNPYRLHQACERLPGCTSCVNRLCPRACRNDAGRVCVQPAVEHYDAQLLSECTVERLEVDERMVVSATCDHRGDVIRVRGRCFVVAMNAIFTPALLLRTSGRHFPKGLANSSGLVGCNLMRHVSDTMSVYIRCYDASPAEEIGHGIGLNDFYLYFGVKLGSLHIHAGPIGSLNPHATGDEPDTRYMAVLVNTIVEDLPYKHNRVLVAQNGRIWCDYKYPVELHKRSASLLNVAANRLRPRCVVRMPDRVGRLNSGHICGTCRFGDNPDASVLDRYNRAHDVDNLFIVDSSFFPSSGAVAPSLTIAANAIRIGETIATAL